MMFLVTTVVLIGLLAGLALLVLGWRGRRIDDHPWCVACRFDLFALPQSTRTCPECGAEIQQPGAVRVGQRRRRPIWIALGALLIGFGSVVGGINLFTGISFTAYKPAWVLLWELSHEPLPLATAAGAEIERRIQAGEHSDRAAIHLTTKLLKRYGEIMRSPNSMIHNDRLLLVSEVLHVACDDVHKRLDSGCLSPEDLQELLDLSLVFQADLSIWVWPSGVASIVEDSWRLGLMEEAQWQRYLHQAVEPSLSVRQRINAGDPIPIVIRWNPRLAGMTELPSNVQLQATARLISVRIGSQSASNLDLPDAYGPDVMQVPYPSWPPNKLITRDVIDTTLLEPGSHTIEGEVEVNLFWTRDPETSLARYTRKVTERFTLLPDDLPSLFIDRAASESGDPPPGATFVHRGSLRSIDVVGVRMPFNLVTIFLRLEDDMPLGVACDVLLETESHPKHRLGSIVGRLAPGGYQPVTFPHSVPTLRRGEEVRVFLVPNPDLARRTIELHQVWGEPIEGFEAFRP